MFGSIESVLYAAIVFVGGHFALSSRPIRTKLVGRIGENAFVVLYSLIVAAALVWLAIAFNRAPLVELWPEPGWGRAALMVVMLIASVFFVCSVSSPNPTAVGAEKRTAGIAKGRGIFAVTRHPMLWSFALWAIGHLIVNGDAAAVILFGGLALLSLGGMAHIDAKRRATGGEVWQRLEASTSAIPFLALMTGRARWGAARIVWWQLAVGLVVFAAFYHLHGPVIGFDPS